MLDVNFSKFNTIGNILNDFNQTQLQTILKNKAYLQLTKIEYKYYDLLLKGKSSEDYFKIKDSILHDFGSHEILLKYLVLIFKEKYLLKIYRKINHDLLIKALKLQILIQLFISTIRYGNKILMKPEFKQLEPDAVISNFRLYAIMINPQYLYRYLGLLSFEQARILQKLLNVEISWDVDETNSYLDIARNNLMPLKIFNLEKEIIRETTDDDLKEKEEYGMLMYHTYMKLFINFIAENMRFKNA